MRMQSPAVNVILLTLFLALAACSPQPRPMDAATPRLPYESDFAAGPGPEWSVKSTFPIDAATVLGLFNSRNPKVPAEAVLRLPGVPPGSSATVSGNLYLVGSWDSTGQLTDCFSVTTPDGKAYYTLSTFPSRIEDNDEEKPVGNDGLVRIPYSERALGYWIVPMRFTVPADAIRDGTLLLTFRGEVSARRVEFWGLGDLRVEAP